MPVKIIPSVTFFVTIATGDSAVQYKTYRAGTLIFWPCPLSAGQIRASAAWILGPREGGTVRAFLLDNELPRGEVDSMVFVFEDGFKKDCTLL